MHSRLPLRAHAGAVVAYIALAVAFTWPLVVHLGDGLTGDPAGDTGVYIWNLWVFQHELIDHRSTPYFTDHLFGPRGHANLSLHNYTSFQNVLALPLVRSLGVVPAFNIVYLLMTVMTAYAMFLLAIDLTGVASIAWLAGLLFAWSPVMTTRGMGHYSLVAAASLPLLLLVLRRAAVRERTAHALVIGTLVWWAATTDAYYAVYCLLIIVAFITARAVGIERRPAASKLLQWALTTLILALAALVLATAVAGGWEFQLLGRTARMRTLYTPVLILTALTITRVLLNVKISGVPISRQAIWRTFRLAAVAGVVAALLLSPALYALGRRVADGDFQTPSIFWRSSPRGVDLLSFVLPNPNHPLVPSAIARWSATLHPDGYLESVASIPFAVLLLLGVAWVRGWRPSRCAAPLTVTFGLLALGPFVHIAGVNTFVPGPWALLRYVPVIGLARTPARAAVLLMLMVAVLFATALAALLKRNPQSGTRLVLVVGLILAFELLPAPRTLHSAAIPSIYRHVAAAPETVSVLELPFGIRDGTSGVGNYIARTQFYQTAHGKTIMGGYLSRVMPRRRRDIESQPALNALALLSERRTLSDEQIGALMENGAAFIRDANIGFVIIDRSRASPVLSELATGALQLELIETSGTMDLFRPRLGARAR